MVPSYNFVGHAKDPWRFCYIFGYFIKYRFHSSLIIISRHSWINSLVWRYPWETKTLSWLCPRACWCRMNTDNRIWVDVDEETYDGLRDGAFDARDVKAQREGVPRWGCYHSVATKQREQLIFAPRRKVVLLLQQKWPHCAFILQSKEQRMWKCKECNGQWRLCICNA